MDKQKEQVLFQTFHNQIGKPEFSQRLTIFFGLRGSCIVRYQSAQYQLARGGMLVVNPFELYQVECLEDGELLCMTISRSLLQLGGWERQSSCSCYVSGTDDRKEYQKLRELFATVFRDYFQNREKHASAIAANTLKIIDMLLDCFAASGIKTEGGKQEENLYRIKKILDYIHDHWKV